MKHIRPWGFFGDEPGRVAQLTIPHRRATGGLMLLESMCLIAAMKQVQARTVFEFGTFMGATTLNLAMNLPEDGRVYTFDLSPEEAAKLRQHGEDEQLTRQHLASEMDFASTPYANHITRIFGNSHTFDPSALAGCCDLVFVDGGHDHATVKADTASAFRLVRKGGVILWHDYLNPIHPDVTTFLDALDADTVHVEDTKLCVVYV